jgi:hypothetical protein
VQTTLSALDRRSTVAAGSAPRRPTLARTTARGEHDDVDRRAGGPQRPAQAGGARVRPEPEVRAGVPTRGRAPGHQPGRERHKDQQLLRLVHPAVPPPRRQDDHRLFSRGPARPAPGRAGVPHGLARGLRGPVRSDRTRRPSSRGGQPHRRPRVPDPRQRRTRDLRQLPARQLPRHKDRAGRRRVVDQRPAGCVPRKGTRPHPEGCCERGPRTPRAGVPQPGAARPGLGAAGGRARGVRRALRRRHRDPGRGRGGEAAGGVQPEAVPRCGGSTRWPQSSTRYRRGPRPSG